MIAFPIPLAEAVEGEIVLLVQHGINACMAQLKREEDGVVRVKLNGGYTWLRVDEYGVSWEAFK